MKTRAGGHAHGTEGTTTTTSDLSGAGGTPTTFDEGRPKSVVFLLLRHTESITLPSARQ